MNVVVPRKPDTSSRESCVQCRAREGGGRAFALEIRFQRRGFTLLEVLIALAVVSLVLIALVRTAGTAARALDREREVTLATYVAANVLAEQRVAGGVPPIGRREGRQRLGAREWRWQSVVQATDEPAIRRIDVRVFAGDTAEESVVTLAGFAGSR